MLTVPTDFDRWLDRRDYFAPSPEFEEWAREAFIDDPSSQFYNPDHGHLSSARIGFLLTSTANESQGVRTLGTCGLAQPTGKPWSVGRQVQQLEEWFGTVPDFLITLDAVWLSTAQPLQICALTEHEIYHAAIQKDRWGEARYTRDDEPIWGLRSHDVEEFSGVVRRYGAWKPELEEFKSAISAEPVFGNVSLGGRCGCGKRL